MAEENEGFSPFSAPLREKKKDEVKFEEIPESELHEGETGGEGKKNPNNPQDAPEFIPPVFDDIPSADFGEEGEEGEENEEEEEESHETEVPDAFSEEFSEYTAKWLVDIYFRLFLAGVKQYCKIDRSEVLKAINEGYIHPKFLKFVDEANDNVDDNIKITDDEKNFIIEPLKYFMKIKKIKLKPEYMVLTSLVMVSGSIFMNSMDLKEQNRTILDKIMKESSDIKRAEEKERTKSEPQNVESFTNSTTINPDMNESSDYQEGEPEISEAEEVQS